MISLRKAGFSAALVASFGSIGFLLGSGRDPTWLLLAIMVLWVVAPFVVLMVAGTVSKRWPAPVRKTLYVLMLVLTLGTLIAYVDDALRPRKAQAAFVFVIAPLVSWGAIAIVIPAAALIFRKRPRQTTIS